MATVPSKLVRPLGWKYAPVSLLALAAVRLTVPVPTMALENV